MPYDPDRATFDPICPSSTFPFQIGDKWTGMIVLCLQPGPRRFGDLRRQLRTITPKVLTETLRAMRRSGFVTRAVHPGNPPRTDYELTALGLSLLDLVEAARAWSGDHLEEMETARRKFDAVDDQS